jgi:antitoxin component YwqK of YwqJK toxin-antitoxin module
MYAHLNKLVFILILFLFSGIICAQNNSINPNGYNIFYFENGKVSSEGTMKEGKPDGYWKNYHKNGTIKIEGNRKNFLLDSIWKFYSESGKIQKSLNYSLGKKNGISEIFDTSGNVITRENYSNDIKNGNTITYHINGKTKQIIPFKNGKAEGVSYEYTPDSILISIITYKYGFIEKQEKINRRDANGNKQGLWKEFYSDGKVKTEEKYRDGKLDGYKKEYDSKGEIKNIEKFSNGKVEKNAQELIKPEIFRSYHDNGYVKYEGTYLNGMPQGTHYHFNKDGFPDSAIIYSDGYLIEKGPVDTGRRKQNAWIEFHFDGEAKGKGNYKDDLKNGIWKYYHTNGKLEQEGKYNKYGRPTGVWKWYYESGNILREENYLDGKREGLLQEYKEDGKIITKGEYFDDMQEGPWYYEMENYKEIGNYRAGLPDSIWKAYYIKENRLRFEGNFLQGEPDGKHTWFYSDGRPQFTGKYSGGMKQGDWKHYDESGLWDLTITYENDIEMKWDGIKVLPTYEESLRVYETAKKKAVPEKVETPSVEKNKKTRKEENEIPNEEAEEDQ